MKLTLRHIFTAIIIIISIPAFSFAYVDPNTGGYVFQVLFPIISALGAAYLFFKNHIKKMFNNIKAMFKRKNGV